MARTFVDVRPTRSPDLVTAAPTPIYEIAHQAYQVLHWGFVALPVIAGLDKFANLLASWEQYLSPQLARMLPFTPAAFMRIAGIVEVFAGLLVAVKPRIGAYVV